MKKNQPKNSMEIIIKLLQKIFEKFLYYDRAIDLTILMSMNSLEAVQINAKIKPAKQITSVLNYSASHTDIVTEYRRSGMILHISSDTNYIS